MTSYALSIGTPGTPDVALLGAKGASLARMVQLGLPVPPGFTLTTATCRYLQEHGSRPPGLAGDVDRHLDSLEAETGRRFGDPDDPLLLAVRPGAPSPVPGLMDTVLDLGLTAASVPGLARATGDERFAWDCYRRLIQLYGELVLGVPGARFAEATDAVLAEHGGKRLSDLDAGALGELAARSDAACVDAVGRGLPQDPRRQLDLAIDAAFASWNDEVTRLGRRQCGVPDSAGVAVTVQAMVYGNRGTGSGTGLAFTRSPVTGEPGDHGFYLPDAQGEEALSSARPPLPLTALRSSSPESYRRLQSVMDALERHHRDMCEVEFTVESGRLWILQAGAGGRSPAAAFRIAADLVEEGTITDDEALLRVTGDQLTQLMLPVFDEASAGPAVAAGLGVSPGVAVGRVVLDAETAAVLAARGEDVVLFCVGNGDDLRGLPHACSVVMAAGGPASSAAIAARSRGVPAVCRVPGLELDGALRHVLIGGRRQLAEGDVVSIDGEAGRIYRGHHRTKPSALRRRLEGEAADPAEPFADAVLRLLGHADRTRRLRVGADVTTATDVRRAMRYGADSVGLCRCESQLAGDRRAYVDRVRNGSDESERAAALAQLGRLQREAYAGILDAAQGRRVTIRLLGSDRSIDVGADLLESQVGAVFEAAADLRHRGRPFELELLVPQVGAVGDLEAAARRVRDVAHRLAARTGPIRYRLGASIETPEAGALAGLLATEVDFLALRVGAGTAGPVVAEAVADVRAARADVPVGVWGSAATDPASLAVFERAGVDFVVCPPDQVPAARVEAARAALLPTGFLADPVGAVGGERADVLVKGS
jgi:pyruvate,orthophosphate dikinase